MAESEDDVYRRIAKQNRTTVEQEKEKERLRQLARTNGDGEADSSPGVVHTSTPATQGANPFVNALVGIYLAGFVVGGILVAIGATDAGSYSPGEFSFHRDNGVAWIVWGGAFLNLGIVAALVHIGSAAVLWQLERLGESKP